MIENEEDAEWPDKCMEDSDSFNRHIDSTYISYKGCYLWKSEFETIVEKKDSKDEKEGKEE